MIGLQLQLQVNAVMSASLQKWTSVCAMAQHARRDDAHSYKL